MDALAITRSAGQHVVQSNSVKTAEAASQFEALLIASMLKASREAGASWLGAGEDGAGTSAMSYAEEHLAQVLASQGGLGIAAAVVAGLEHQNRPYTADNAGAAGAAATAAGMSRPEL